MQSFRTQYDTSRLRRPIAVQNLSKVNKSSTWRERFFRKQQKTRVVNRTSPPLALMSSPAVSVLPQNSQSDVQIQNCDEENHALHRERYQSLVYVCDTLNASLNHQIQRNENLTETIRVQDEQTRAVEIARHDLITTNQISICEPFSTARDDQVNTVILIPESSGAAWFNQDRTVYAIIAAAAIVIVVCVLLFLIRKKRRMRIMMKHLETMRMGDVGEHVPQRANSDFVHMDIDYVAKVERDRLDSRGQSIISRFALAGDQSNVEIKLRNSIFPEIQVD